MNEPIWNQYLSQEEKEIFAGCGWGARAGFGKRPALAVIDVSYGFCGEKDQPVAVSQQKWPLACGPGAWEAVGHIKRLVDKAHQAGVPVFYTTGERRPDRWDAGSWAWKNSRIRQWGVEPANRDHHKIVEEIAPAPQDVVIIKQKPSGFFGTNLASFMTLLGCDSLIVTGTTTSGCIRATVLDGFSMNYRMVVAEEACFDRFPVSHAINLFDMNCKYADVLKTNEILEYFDTLPAGLFDLPQGRA
ncbi:MAG: isochorismatase family protein [Pigmentiphaga sp.]|uniref:isochorismatase family protein n=1 Tax=Pigmentiphaga sp. TaxID=1977564 RepID=UPI0029AD7860|nr:isochorismatase family protein [Pigmentiphaga sp.]MDX3907148.1 isochorismatase family protein [Pigmentiphaga sp.]